METRRREDKISICGDVDSDTFIDRCTQGWQASKQASNDDAVTMRMSEPEK